MAFTSGTFLLLVAAAVAVYYVTPGRWQWLVLLAASMVFYLAGGLQALVWLLTVIAVTWAAGLLLQRLNDSRSRLEKGDKAAQTALRRKKKAVVAAACVLCFGLLFAMKYWDSTGAVGRLQLPAADPRPGPTIISLSFAYS